MIIRFNETKVMLDSHPKEVGKYPLITKKDATDCWYWMYTLIIQVLIFFKKRKRLHLNGFGCFCSTTNTSKKPHFH